MTHMGSEALFLHFDEDLTNGRRIPASTYTSEDLVFWLHWYSLFFDKLYIPANHFTDATATTAKAFQTAGIEKPDSILRWRDDPVAPVMILWDDSRFPYSDFQDLFNATDADPLWCTARDRDASQASAKLCDAAGLNVKRVDMTAKLDRAESVEQLRKDVFNSSRNEALNGSQIQRLRDFLRVIEQRRGESDTYSRNFYYSLFGYGQTPELQRLTSRFSDVVGKYKALSNHFLTAVDYVSHSLKAHFASEALKKLALQQNEKLSISIDVLMPDEYAKSVRPPRAIDLSAGMNSELDNLAPHPIVHTIDRNAIIALKKDHLRSLRTSEEYLEFQTAVRTIRESNVTNEKVSKRAEIALNNYLARVAKTLRPIRSRYQESVSALGAVKWKLATVVVLIAIGYSKLPPEVVNDTRKSLEDFGKIVEVFARAKYQKSTLGQTQRQTDHGQRLPAMFRLGSDINVYL
jgi:hypothetical protein